MKTKIIILILTCLSLSACIKLQVTPQDSAEGKHRECLKYNNGARNGSCTEGAPSYCKTIYFPPSCEICQDGTGCGYKE